MKILATALPVVPTTKPLKSQRSDFYGVCATMKTAQPVPTKAFSIASPDDLHVHYYADQHLLTGQGLKYYFLTLPIVTRAAYSSPSRGSHGKHGKHGKIYHFYNGMEMLLLRLRGFRFNT